MFEFLKPEEAHSVSLCCRGRQCQTRGLALEKSPKRHEGGKVRTKNMEKFVFRGREKMQTQTSLSLSGWFDIRVAGVADDVVHSDHGPGENAREGRIAVVGKVTINLPRFSVVHGALDHHGSRPKRLQADKDQQASYYCNWYDCFFYGHCITHIWKINKMIFCLKTGRKSTDVYIKP